MILAAGVGSRLDPLTSQTPKPLCPVLGLPVMEHIIRLCKKHGFTNLAANTHVMADKIENYFKDADKKLGVKLNLVHETRLTGVCGGIRTCRQYLTDDVILVIMGDALTDADLSDLYETHIKNKCEVTIGYKEVEDTSQFGVIVTGKNNKVISFQEKPKPSEAKSNLANTGIYLFNQNILRKIPPFIKAPQYDVAKGLFPKIMSENISMQAIDIKAYWADIGTLKQYHESIMDTLNGKVKIDVICEKTSYGFKEKNVFIDPTSSIQGKVYFGENVKIGRGVTLKGNVYLEKNCVVEEGAYIDNSVIWSNSRIGKNVKVINSILGNNCTVNNGVEMIANSVWAPDTVIEISSRPSFVLN